MLCIMLQRLLIGPMGLASVGLPLHVELESRMLYGKLASLLSDGDGLRMGLDWKGATSLKPCIKHFNVWKKDCVRTVTNAAKRASFILLPFVACQTQPHRTAGWLSSSLASSTSRVVIVPCFASGTPRRFFGQVTSLSKLTAVMKRAPSRRETTRTWRCRWG